VIGIDPIMVEGKEVRELQTKYEERAIEARSLRDQGRPVFIQVEHQTRQRESGGVWDNYYYAGIGNGSQAAPSQPQASSSGWDDPAPKQQRRSSGSRSQDSGPRRKAPEEEWQIALSVGAKLAVDTLPLMEVAKRDFGTQREICLAWANVIFTTPMPSGDNTPPPSYEQQPTGPTSTAPGAYDEPDGPSPDDIPY